MQDYRVKEVTDERGRGVGRSCFGCLLCDRHVTSSYYIWNICFTVTTQKHVSTRTLCPKRQCVIGCLMAHRPLEEMSDSDIFDLYCRN